MIHTADKIVVTRKLHRCAYCNFDIRVGDKANWFKTVCIAEDDMPNLYYQGYLCKDCSPIMLREAAKEASEG